MVRDAGQETGEAEGFALPSRAEALDHCRSALLESGRPAPVLLTGEAGVGKTWLWSRLAAERAGGLRWLAVDLAPSSDPDDLHRAISLALGLAGTRPSRRDLAEALAEGHEDGRRWALVVDEAHNASAEVLEEIRLLSNLLGRPGGFAALLLSGQTRLARRLATSPMAALEARIGARAHLRPIDADEARDLLLHHLPGPSRGMAEADHLHREAGGNPRRLLRLAAALSVGRPPASRPRSVRPEAVPVAPRRLGESRPPLRVEDGAIEVGWEGPDEAVDDDPGFARFDSSRPLAAVATDPTGADEIVHDHYAALQARNEQRSRNQGLPASSLAEPASGDPEREPGPAAEPSPSAASSLVWADEQQGFAPYSQLFSRLRQATDSEG